MSGVREFFVSEANECLDELERRLTGSQTIAETEELLRHARRLRGSAQMAREEETATVARTLETGLRDAVDRTAPWNDTTTRTVRETIADLRKLVEATEPDDARKSRIARALERWRQPNRPEDQHTAAALHVNERPGAEFFAYAAGEVSAILAALERALPTLSRAPRGRDPLKSILRRQRALLGAAQLESLPDVAETLRAIDQVCRLIARHDVAVTDTWLDFFRAARDVLADAAGSLMGGPASARAPSMPRLRDLRTRLLARVGEAEPVPSPPAAVVATPPPAETGDFFRTEARILLMRTERVARDLETAAPDRQTTLRRELGATLAALRDTAKTFSFGEAARLAETARGRADAGEGTEILALLPALQDAIETTGTVDTAVVDDSPIVPVEELLYQGESALRRAREVVATLEHLIADDPAAREAVDELTDLLDLIRP